MELSIQKQDIEPTISAIKESVDDFKKKYPNGAVVLMSHTGNKISEMIRKDIPEIDIILNGHDHENKTILNISKIPQKVSNSEDVYDTKPEATVSLGCNNEIMKSINLHFNDNGKLDDKFIIQTYYTNSGKKDSISDNKIYNMIRKDFAKDLVPIVQEIDFENKITELKAGKFMCWQNTLLLNFLTSTLMDVLKNEFSGEYDDVHSLALQTSGIRGGIKNGSTNLDLMKVFDGVNEDLSVLYVGNVSGKDLIGMIVENVKDNLGRDKRERNTLMCWSDIQINRSLIDDILSCNSDKSLTDAIKLRDDDNKFTKSIDLTEDYRIILPTKYLIKTDIEYPNKIRKNFKPIGKTPDELFRIALSKKKYRHLVNEKVKENRIINTRNDR